MWVSNGRRVPRYVLWSQASVCQRKGFGRSYEIEVIIEITRRGRSNTNTTSRASGTTLNTERFAATYNLSACTPKPIQGDSKNTPVQFLFSCDVTKGCKLTTFSYAGMATHSTRYNKDLISRYKARVTSDGSLCNPVPFKPIVTPFPYILPSSSKLHKQINPLNQYQFRSFRGSRYTT